MTLMSIGAAIVTYHNTDDQINTCLRSLRNNGIKHISLVSNNQNNRGFSVAANLAANKLSDDFILFINPDAYLLPHIIPSALQFFAHHKQVGIIGLGLYDNKRAPEKRSYGKSINLLSLITRHVLSVQYRAKTRFVGWVSGGAMIIRRSLFHQLSGFDQTFFLYWEDVDLCFRARRLGWQVAYLPHLKVIHQRGASLDNQALKTKLYDESADKYFCKHYSKPICLLQRHLRFLYRLFSRWAD